jgi:hypothetical protein
MLRAGKRLYGALALAVSVALAWPAVAAAQDPMHQAKELYDEGSTLYSAADYNGAIQKFTEALKIVTTQGSDDDFAIRGALLLNIAQAHVHAHDIDADLSHLRAARSIYNRFVDEADRGAGYDQKDVATSRTAIEELDLKIDEAEDRAGKPGPGPSEPGPAGPGSTDELMRTRGIGIGLLVPGVVLVVGGVGVLAYGTTFRNFALQSVRDDANDQSLQYGDLDAEQKAHVDDETSKGRIWMAVGGVAAGIGVAGVAVGAVFLAKAARLQKKSKPPTTSLVPTLGPGTAGLSLSGRF